MSCLLGHGTAPIKLLVRLDANHLSGLGHAVRVRGLLEQLTTPLDLAIVGGGEVLAAIFPQARHFDMPSASPECVAQALQCFGASAYLSDPPEFQPWEAELVRSRFGLPMVAIDDFGGPLCADLVINGTVLPEYHRYPMLPERATVLSGPKYSLVNPVFAQHTWHAPVSPNVTIVVGGGERAMHWVLRLVSGELECWRWAKVRVVVGRAFPAFAELATAAVKCQVDVLQALPPEKLAVALSESSLALITGGMIVYEALAVGVPSIVFPQLENLIAEADWFAAQGAIVNLGFSTGMDPGLVGQQLEYLLADPVAAARQSVIGRHLIDGRGMLRAAAAFDEFLQTRFGKGCA